MKTTMEQFRADIEAKLWELGRDRYISCGSIDRSETERVINTIAQHLANGHSCIPQKSINTFEAVLAEEPQITDDLDAEIDAAAEEAIHELDKRIPQSWIRQLSRGALATIVAGYEATKDSNLTYGLGVELWPGMKMPINEVCERWRETHPDEDPVFGI